jgi:hypothetical protein
MKGRFYAWLRLISIVIILLAAVPAGAQQVLWSITGTVTDRDTGRGIASVSVAVAGEHVATVTNSDGQFLLKVRRNPVRLVFTHVGYLIRSYDVNAQTEPIKISMKASTVMLSEILVTSGEPLDILKAAIERIPVNYSRSPELFRGFYRETTQRGHRYIYVGEAVVDMYKTGYSRPPFYDRVSIDRARRLVSPKSTDTLGAKVQGGPTLPLYMDVVKNSEVLFTEEELRHYEFTLMPPTTIGNRVQLVLSMKPRDVVPYPLYFGTIYIDRGTLAFTRIELQLDMSDRAKATQMMLVRKPVGVRFRPRDMLFVMDYRLEDGVSRLSYVRSESRFNCDWKRKLFHSSYRVVAEMAVTDRYPQPHALSGHNSFSSNASLYDKVEWFAAPDFWGGDNIIEPTESLENAIDKLRKKLSHTK